MSASRLLDQVRITARLRHFSLRTEKAYVNHIKRFILFHGKRHPSELNENHVREYLSHLATNRSVSASTQNVALAALLFLYRDVLRNRQMLGNTVITPLGLELRITPSQGSRTERQPWAKLHNRFALCQIQD
jgi:site-specific recombinase XerD